MDIENVAGCAVGAGKPGFDLTEVLDIPNVRTAWLSYVFRRIERTIEDGRPTLVVLDEAWKLLDDAYFQSRLKDWMLTMRKKNVAVIMLTQRVSHIAESRAGSFPAALAAAARVELPLGGLLAFPGIAKGLQRIGDVRCRGVANLQMILK